VIKLKKINWSVVVLRVILIGPFVLMMGVGDQAEKIVDWLSDRLPNPCR